MVLFLVIFSINSIIIYIIVSIIIIHVPATPTQSLKSMVILSIGSRHCISHNFVKNREPVEQIKGDMGPFAHLSKFWH